MTIEEAIEQIREVGTICAENGNLRVRFPEIERPRLETAIDVLRINKLGALELLSTASTIPPAEHWPESLRRLADERTAALGDAKAARKEVWISWAQWKAKALRSTIPEQR